MVKNYTFTYKKTTLDYVLFDKSVLTLLHRYLTYVEGSFSLTSDNLPIIATFNLRAMQCHHLKTSQTKLLAWHKATAENIAEYRNKIDQLLSAAFGEDLRNETDISVYIDNLTKILH